MAAAQIDSMPALRSILGSEGWDGLTGRLLDYVENFDFKVVESRGGFQL
jgi:hypothetical protein